MAIPRKSDGCKRTGLRLYIRTFGCQMNMRDSEIILGMLQEAGFNCARRMEEADIILFNTCSVRQHAEERVLGQVGMLRETDKIIGIVGCMAQNYQEEIFHRMPHVDLVCGPANIYDIPELLKKAIKENRQVLAVDKAKRPLHIDCNFRTNKLKAYVSIMYGCNNFCSYCIVPYVRGRQRSRPLRHILTEVKCLAERGCKEITLLGQNVNSYGQDLRGKMNFVTLLKSLDKIKGIERIRFVTSHPKDASRQLFWAMRDLGKVCEHLHLPLQAGSDKVLRAMNRGYTLEKYLKLIENLRRIIPDCSLTTDIIVGFPGESETEFKKTISAMQQIQFDEAFIFKYSPRRKTKAAQLKDDVPQDVKRQRNQRLLALQKQISLQKNKDYIAKSVQVLAEGKGHCLTENSRKAVLQGRTRTNKVTLFSGKKELISQLIDVKINKVLTHTLMGEADGKNY